MDLVFRAIIVSFTTPAAVEFSVCIGVGDRGQPISISVWRNGTSSFDEMKSAPSSALAAEDIKFLMTWAIVNMGPLKRGNGFCLSRKTCATARLWPMDSLWNPASMCVASTILLAL